MLSSHPHSVPCQWFSWLSAALDRRSARGSPACSLETRWGASMGVREGSRFCASDSHLAQVAAMGSNFLDEGADRSKSDI
jgi:hypothetical protein